MRMILKYVLYERGENTTPPTTEEESIMKFEVVSSPAGSHWYIKVNGQVVEGAPKRGHGRATKAQMIEWARELEEKAS